MTEAEYLRRLISLHARIYPSPCVPGQWNAYCVDLALVAHGDDPKRAFETLREACKGVITRDAKAGLDPRKRRATEWDWEIIYDLMDGDHRLDGAALDREVEYGVRFSLVEEPRWWYWRQMGV